MQRGRNCCRPKKGCLPDKTGQAEDGAAMKTWPTHTEVYGTKRPLRKAATLKLERDFTGRRVAGESGRLASEAGPTWALRNESVRAISEDGPTWHYVRQRWSSQFGVLIVRAQATVPTLQS